MTTKSWIRNLFARPVTRTIRKPHRARLALEQLEGRLTPAAPAISIPYNGGPLLTHVQVQGVYYNDPATLGLQSRLDGFFTDIVQSPWLTQMLANYSVPNYTIGAGSFLGDDNTGVTVPDGSFLSESMIQGLLSSEIANHKLAAPNGNTLYAVFAPADSGAGPGAGGFHSTFIDPGSGKAIYYMVMSPGAGADFNSYTETASHELSEAITDPGITGGSLANPEGVIGWFSRTYDEIGDVAVGEDVTYHGYVMQEMWGRSPADPPLLALGPVVAPADTDFAVTRINNPTAGAFNGVFATFTDKDGASESPSQSTVNVQWGDGTISRSDDGSGDVTVTSNGDGTFNVIGRHTYFDAAGTTYGGFSLPLGGIYGAQVSVSSGDESAQTTTPITLLQGGALPPLLVNTTSAALFPGADLLSLPRAILVANSDVSGRAIITFDPKVFATPQTITLTGSQLELSNRGETETITGPAAGVTVNGGGLSRVFQVDGLVTASISGLTITGGKTASYGGGGGLTNLGTVTLTNCTVSGNSAGFGGGLENSGTATLTNCAVSGNSAYLGGGLRNRGTATLSNCTVSGNSANNGGGLNNSSGTATLTNCTISGNSAANLGGGLRNSGTARLTNCTVSGNSASYGGGVFANLGTAALTNCTVSGNSAASNGGGLYVNAYAAIQLTNCTVTGNSARNDGGGLFNRRYAGYYGTYSGTAALTNCTVSGNSAASNGGGLYNQGTLTVGNTLVAGNTASSSGPDAVGTITSLGHNLIGATDGSTGWVGSDLTGTVAAPLIPLLAPLGKYGGPTQTMPLLPGSPAIDSGTSTGAPALDQRGQGRVGAVDIGAFESQGFTIAVTSGSGQATDISTAFAALLVVTVTPNNPIEPVAGGLVTFTPPSSGASATISGSPAIIGAAGTASVTATANGFAGSYSVSATARGITTPASFSLSNRPTITVPAAQAAYQNVDQPISGIVIGDAPSATLTVTLSVNHGTLTLGTTTGLTTVTGNGTGSVTLTGATADLNAALASLAYRASHNYSGGDTLSLTATDSGVSATPASLALTVQSIAQEKANLQARVSALQTAGVLNQGQANSLIVKLNLQGNNGDSGKVQAFLNEVQADLNAGILTQAQADALLYWGNILLLSVTRR
jgi:parallel beta-helix repeat protein